MTIQQAIDFAEPKLKEADIKSFQLDTQLLLSSVLNKPREFLIANQDKKKEAISIGPTIAYPHSLREECDLDSVGRMAKIVKEIIKG